MKSVEAVGKNIEQAIENALFELKATREDVDIKIISEGGLFRKAKVVVSISEDAIEKYEKKEENKKKLLAEDEDGICIKKSESSSQPEEKKEEKEIKKEIKKEEKDSKKEVKKEEKAEIKTNESKKEEKTIAPQEFLENICKLYGKEVSIEEKEEDGCKIYSVNGEDVGSLIGYRGECLFAISYLTSVLAGKNEKRILVDIGGYREKRISTLKTLAGRMATKVIKSNHYVKLEPMDASERRIIHLALQNNDKVTTLSKGTEPHRFVMIFPREYKD